MTCRTPRRLAQSTTTRTTATALERVLMLADYDALRQRQAAQRFNCRRRADRYWSRQLQPPDLRRRRRVGPGAHQSRWQRNRGHRNDIAGASPRGHLAHDRIGRTWHRARAHHRDRGSDRRDRHRHGSHWVSVRADSRLGHPRGRQPRLSPKPPPSQRRCSKLLQRTWCSTEWSVPSMLWARRADRLAGPRSPSRCRLATNS